MAVEEQMRFGLFCAYVLAARTSLDSARGFLDPVAVVQFDERLKVALGILREIEFELSEEMMDD